MFAYHKRILASYLGGGRSHLSFWHEEPALNEFAFMEGSRQFYMTFREKSDYAGPFDGQGIPMLDYHGKIGLQYNPIAIAQYGLGCWNRYQDGRDRSTDWKARAYLVADWLVAHLEPNEKGLAVWMHHFDWEYFRTLKSPWYSGLAQGQGIALLVRAWQDSGDQRYLQAADRAFISMVTSMDEGGLLYTDEAGDWWVEEYITQPATHILNGYLWALWGVLDYAREPSAAHHEKADELWKRGIATLTKKLPMFDAGFWSTYDLAPTKIRNLASPFYHKLHIVQLAVMHRLSKNDAFARTCEAWRAYQTDPWTRRRAFVQKAIFKLLYY